MKTILEFIANKKPTKGLTSSDIYKVYKYTSTASGYTDNRTWVLIESYERLKKILKANNVQIPKSLYDGLETWLNSGKEIVITVKSRFKSNPILWDVFNKKDYKQFDEIDVMDFNPTTWAQNNWFK